MLAFRRLRARQVLVNTTSVSLWFQIAATVALSLSSLSLSLSIRALNPRNAAT